jgi:hypothetical protein
MDDAALSGPEVMKGEDELLEGHSIPIDTMVGVVGRQDRRRHASKKADFLSSRGAPTNRLPAFWNELLGGQPIDFSVGLMIFTKRSYGPTYCLTWQSKPAIVTKLH